MILLITLLAVLLGFVGFLLFLFKSGNLLFFLTTLRMGWEKAKKNLKFF